MPRPLAGLRVFDLTHAGVGPWSTMLLGSLGASVVKVEPPEGEIGRDLPPFKHGRSLVFDHQNLNKRGITLNLKDPSARSRAYAFLRHADVLVQNFRPGVAERIGMGYAEVSKVNPQIIYASATAWGNQGPMSGMGAVDPTVQAYSGWVALNGVPGNDGEFLRFYAHLDYTTGSFLMGAILNGLLLRQKTGKGCRVDVTMLGSALNLQITRLAEYSATGESPARMGTANPTTVPEQAFRCLDGKWLAVAAVNDKQWAALCRAIGNPSLAADQGFQSNALRVTNRNELVPLLEDAIALRPLAFWSTALSRLNVPHAPFLDFYGVRHHQQTTANGYIAEIDTPNRDKVLIGASPWKFDGVAERPRPAPSLGQHNADVNRLLDRWSSSGKPVSPLGISANSPLEGTTIVEISEGVSGPFAAQLLADAGARVIKIEPLSGDISRTWGPPFVGGDSSIYLALNRNKESVAIDINAAEGRAIVKHLLSTADGLIEDLGPGKAARLGIDYKSMKKANPLLVHCHLTSFGDDGPLRNLSGTELTVQALSDYPNSLGEVDGPPRRVGADIAGCNAGVFAFVGMLCGLYDSRNRGRGGSLSLSMLGSLLHLRGVIWISASDPDEWYGAHCENWTRPPEFGYQTQDSPIYFSLRRGDELSWVGLLDELGMLNVLADERFANGGREAAGFFGRYSSEVKSIWESAFSKKTADQLIEIFQKYDADAVRVNDYAELFGTPAFDSLKILENVTTSSDAKFAALLPPWQINGSSPTVRARPPLLGEHTSEILLAAGYAEPLIESYRDAGVIRRGKGR